MSSILSVKSDGTTDALEFANKILKESIVKKALLITKKEQPSDLVELCSNQGVAVTVMNGISDERDFWGSGDAIKSSNISNMAFNELLWVPDSGCVYFRNNVISGFDKSETLLFNALKDYLMLYFKAFEESKAMNLIGISK